MKRLMMTIILALFANSAWAEISQRIAWKLNGPLAELQAVVREGVALQAKINPKVRIDLWVTVIAGSRSGSASLIATFEDLAHFAEATMREEANDEWNAFLSRFPADRFPALFTGLSQTVLGGNNAPAKPGEVMAVIEFNAAGDFAEFSAGAERAIEIQGRINPKGQMTMLAPVVVGSATVGAIVTTRYPSMVEWAEGVTKLQSSEEWEEFLSTRPADEYQPTFQALVQAVDIR